MRVEPVVDREVKGGIAVAQDLLKDGEGRFFRGNLHCHSNRSDGLLEPEDVAAAYGEAGFDFICLSDHFEAEYGWRVTDTRHLRDEGVGRSSLLFKPSRKRAHGVS